MNLLLRFTVIAIAGCLAACGGGGGSSPTPIGGGSTAPIASPSPRASVAPSPSASAGASTASVSGHVYQLAGPLSSSTWNLAAPTGCPGNGQNCTSYPTPPPTLPTASSTPAAGAPIAGATVYVVTSGTAAVVNGVPSAPLATATTGSNGSFTAAVPLSPGTSVGVVVVNGSSVSTSTGVTNLGFALTHATATVGTPVTLYADSLSADEQSAIAQLNADRAGASLAPVTSDLTAQVTARISVAQRPGAAACESNENDDATYVAFGGLGAETGWLDGFGASWPAVVDYGSPWNQANIAYVGLAALYQTTTCGSNPSNIPANYFEGMYVAP